MQLQSQDLIAAAIIRIDIMRDEARLEIALITQTTRVPCNIQIFRHDKLDTAHQYVAAGRRIMRGDGHRFHTALVFQPVLIHFGENDASATRLPGHTLRTVTSS